MGLSAEKKYEKGEILVVEFPFSNLSDSKRRPAFVIADLDQEIVLCEITSKNINDKYAVEIQKRDFVQGSLRETSTIRANKIFAADKSIIEYSIGKVNEKKINEVREKIIWMIN